MTVVWKWPNVVLFSVVSLVLGGLVYTGRIPPAALGALIAWLIPSPLKTDDKVKS